MFLSIKLIGKDFYRELTNSKINFGGCYYKT